MRLSMNASVQHVDGISANTGTREMTQVELLRAMRELPWARHK